jgi:small subunit ribosomal protein S6e
LGDDFKGYVFKITGGFDKQGFAMVQGVATNGRVRLMLDVSTGMYTPKRPGCRKRKSIRGCIVGTDLSCLNLVIVRKGPSDLPGLTDPDSNKPSMRGPKRATKIRKLWGLTKDDDVRLFVPKRKITREGKKDYVKSPKIQRLVTPTALRRKRRRVALKQQRYASGREQQAKYEQILAQVRKEKRAALLSKKREMHSERASSKKDSSKPATAPPKKDQPKGGAPKAATTAGAAPKGGAPKAATTAPKTDAPKAAAAPAPSTSAKGEQPKPQASQPKQQQPKSQSQQQPKPAGGQGGQQPKPAGGQGGQKGQGQQGGAKKQ